jgi:hypothetical protein
VTNERLRLILDYAFGIALNLGILLLARGVGLNQVEEKSSYGLGPIISMLGAVDVLWAQGMWGNRRSRGEELQKEKP